ncbi:pumilio homolog 3-like [Clavelina lepadiformis]|uniref:PUM-HD domain-containing protein n=1 Tax=Clavelina lepadiformis TaxID=159417 RepID=A0ABP0FKK8_CLALP
MMVDRKSVGGKGRKRNTNVSEEKEHASPSKKLKMVETEKKFKPGSKGKTSVKKQPLPKETAKSRRERKLYRKKQNPNYELTYNAKKIWEKLRIQKSQLSKDEKAKLVEELMALVKQQEKKLVNLCYAHDTSRVIQTCLKQGLRNQREEIFNELKEHIVDMCKNGYAKNIVWKMLKYGTPQERNLVMSSFNGLVYRMIRKPKSASVVEYAYNNYATAEQRNFIVRQLYGKVYLLCDDSNKANLSEILTEQPDKKESLLKSFKDGLTPLAEKTVIAHTLVHKAFYEFFDHCDIPAIRTELIEVLRESLIHMMHTHDGAHVAMNCLWHGSSKDRKVIIKTIKEFVLKLCCEEYGHLPILAAFDCVDDTVFLKKALVQHIVKGMDELVHNKYGRKVILYLLSPRNSSYFLPETVKLLSMGDGNKTSKKPMEQRHQELSEAALPGVMEYIIQNLKTIIFDHSLFVLIETAVVNCTGDTRPLIDAVMKLLQVAFLPNTKDEDGHLHIVEDPCGHMVVKRLIITESKEHKTQPDRNMTFSNTLLNEMDGKILASWTACNRGTQILLALVESTSDAVSKKAKKVFQEHLDIITGNTDVKSTKILLQKLT